MCCADRELTDKVSGPVIQKVRHLLFSKHVCLHTDAKVGTILRVEFIQVEVASSSERIV